MWVDDFFPSSFRLSRDVIFYLILSFYLLFWGEWGFFLCVSVCFPCAICFFFLFSLTLSLFLILGGGIFTFLFFFVGDFYVYLKCFPSTIFSFLLLSFSLLFTGRGGWKKGTLLFKSFIYLHIYLFISLQIHLTLAIQHYLLSYLCIYLSSFNRSFCYLSLSIFFLYIYWGHTYSLLSGLSTYYLFIYLSGFQSVFLSIISIFLFISPFLHKLGHMCSVY